ncbi:threonine synthase [Clostridium cavendishii DSM 21758]|uniref:Threonine synthase n=1 Tax=Clostridium cavendishii DSM 21758 TaxID=1121302 RepID=A0A1M6CHL7_9CLOT|nr:threonine synthase [Clostridium cavendishii]SHI60520.1 threonine synthase [Clostridium cavendishii DSM 21758]
MLFYSTRGYRERVFSEEAIISGLAKDGGLFVPEKFPNIAHRLEELSFLTYEALAYEIIKLFFNEFSDDEIKDCVNSAYTGRFKVQVNNNFLELYHGPTSAFKDAALLFLPQIMKKAKEKTNFKNDICILTATSGDTGKAALEGFKDIKGFKIIVFYPKDGVSEIQEAQMRTQKGENTYVVAIDGNFDDAQNGVKAIFSDGGFKQYLDDRGVSISSANSINIGRLIPQIVYYFYGYFRLVSSGSIAMGERINIVVPTGNFGNILAAYYGKRMGLPINKFVCASNENNVLTDFINTGIYDKRRELKLTESPSMDILVSSNLERLLFELSNRDSNLIKELMDELNKNGFYKINEAMKKNMKDFYGGFATEDEVKKAIKSVYEDKNYLIDTHTAVAYSVYQKYRKATGDDSKYLIASTASPFKFVRSILKAVDGNKFENEYKESNDFKLLEVLGDITKNKVPKGLASLENLEIRHNNLCNKQNMEEIVTLLLKVGD